MATWVANGTPGTTSATLPAGTATGDYVMVASFGTAAALPTLPAGWTTCVSRAVSPSIMVSYREKDATWSAMPTFTGAARCVSTTIRPGSGKECVPGASANQGATSTSITWAAMTLNVTDGTSQVLRFANGVRPDVTIPTPTGHTLIDANGNRPGYLTARLNTTTSAGAVSSAVSRSDVWSTAQVEIKDIIGITISQAAYQFFNDGTETGSTALAGVGTAPTIDVTAGDVNTQLRVRLQSTSAAVVPSTYDWCLQWEKNASGTWTDVDAVTTTARSYDSANLTNAEATTNRLGAGSGTFVAGKVAEDGFTDDVGWTATNYTELLYTVKLMQADLLNGDVLRFRILMNDAVSSSMTYSSTPTINVTKIEPAVTQAAYRFYDIAGTEAAGAALAAQDTSISGDLSGADHLSMLRVRMQSTTAADLPATDNWRIQYRINAGAWTNVTATSGAVQGYASPPNVANNDPTTERLTGGTGSFTSGKVRTNGTVNNQGFPGNNFTEFVYTLQLQASLLSNGDVVQFQVLRNAATTGVTYTQIPSINVVKPAPSVTQAGYRIYGTGTESGSTALAAQNTAPSVNVLNDAAVQVRTLLQSTTASAVPSTDDWTLQWEKNSSGTWTALSGGGGGGVTAALYDTVNRDNLLLLAADGTSSALQTFTGNGQPLTKASFFLQVNGAFAPPTGTMVARLYDATRTTVLATSATVNAAVLTSTISWVDFTFDGSFTLGNGTTYGIAFVTPSGATGGSSLYAGIDSSAPTDPGTAYAFASSVWTPQVYDLIFKVQTQSAPVVPYDDPSLTEGAATTNRLTGGSGSFSAGKVSEDGVVDDLGFAGNNFTELVYSVMLKAADFAASDTLRFRVVKNGTTADLTYTQYPSLSVTKAVPKIGTLVDAFDTSLDTAKWAGSAAAPLVQWEDGRIKIESNTNYTGDLRTPALYDLEGSAIFVKVTPPATGEFFMRVRYSDAGHSVNFYWSDGHLDAESADGGSPTTLLSRTYSPTNDAWLRIRESGGTVYWDTSPDSIIWNNMASIATPSWIASHTPSFLYFEAGSATTSYAYVDNVNVSGGPPPPSGTATASWSTTQTATGVRPAVPVKQGSATASWTETLTATGTKPLRGTATAAHVWNISPIQGRRPMGGAATTTHLWTIAPITGKKIMKGQTTATHLWTLAVTSKRIMKGQAPATHVWNTTPATGTAPILGVKQGSATASWTETLTATGKKIQRGAATTSWQAVVGYFIEDDFNGPDQTVILDLGYIPLYDSTLYLDGSGNAIASGYGGVTHPTAVPNNSWMEVAFRLADVASFNISLLFRMPTASESNGTGTGYTVTLSELGTAVNRLGTSKASASPSLVITKDYVVRVDWVGANIKVTLDGVEIINWTDPVPLVGNYVGLYLDNNYGTADKLRYLRAGTAAVGRKGAGIGTATASHVWNAVATSKLIQKGSAVASWSMAVGGSPTLSVTTGFAGWWDADDAATITYSSGAVVSQWNDKSGLGRHLSQASPANQPVRSGAQNGRSTLVFNHHHLVAASAADWKFLHDETDSSIFAVVKLNTGNTYQGVMGTTGSATLGPGFDFLSVSANRDVRHAITGSSDANVIFNQSSPNWYDYGSWFIYRVVSTPLNPSAGLRSEIHLIGGTNGASVHNNTSTNPPLSSNPASPLTIGSRSPGDTGLTWLVGEVAEILTYNRALTGPEVTEVESYLNTKWLVLGGGEPIGKRTPKGSAAAAHLWTIAPATGVRPSLGVAQGTAVATWTATVAPATGKRITKTSSMTAAHVWTTTPATGKRTTRGLADSNHIWTMAPATGKPIRKGQATSTHLWTMVPATGRRVTYGQATADHLWKTQPATGIMPIIGVSQGTAVAVHAWTTAPAIGKKNPQSQVTSSHTWTIAPATGQKFMRGQATSAHTWTSSADGKRYTKTAQVTANHLWNVTPITGKRTMRGQATSAHTWNVAPITGTMPIVGAKQGSAIASHMWNITPATGKRVTKGNTIAAHVWTLIATGKRTTRGSATAAHLWNVTAVGKRVLRSGQVTASHLWTLSAQGVRPIVGVKQGTAIVSHTWTVGPITGRRITRGPATAAAHVWTASPVTGQKTMRGQATSAHSWTSTPATGKKIMGGSTAATHLWSVNPSTGRRRPVALATVIHVWQPTAGGLRFTRATAVVFWKINVVGARGSPGIVGVVQGVWDGHGVVAMQYGDKPIFECLMVEA